LANVQNKAKMADGDSKIISFHVPINIKLLVPNCWYRDPVFQTHTFKKQLWMTLCLNLNVNTAHMLKFTQHSI